MVFADCEAANLRLKLRRAPGWDGVPAEMFASWGPVAGSEVYALWCARISGTLGHKDSISGWGHWKHQGIPKSRKSSEILTVWRLAPALSVQQSRSMTICAIGRSMTEPIPHQFGFVKGRKPMEVTETLGVVFRKAHEWHCPLYIASLEVEKAFVQLEASVERSLLAHDAPEWAIAAFLRELVGQQGWATMAGVTCKEPLVIGSGARQCAPGTHSIWSYVVSEFTKQLVDEWEAQGTLAWCPDLDRWPVLLVSL